jgi:fatty acid desaturase
MITGILLSGVAAALAAWKQMRLNAANPTTRLSIWNAPPPHPIRQPSGSRLLSGAIAAFMVAGVSQFQAANGHGWLWLLLSCLLVTGAMSVTTVIHNRRVASTK